VHRLLFIPLSPALGRKAVGGMMNTPQLAPLSSFEKLWRKRGLLRSSWVLRSVKPRGEPRGRSLVKYLPTNHFVYFMLILSSLCIPKKIYRENNDSGTYP
jgi:hypothetical protein